LNKEFLCRKLHIVDSTNGKNGIQTPEICQDSLIHINFPVYQGNSSVRDNTSANTKRIHVQELQKAGGMSLDTIDKTSMRSMIESFPLMLGFSKLPNSISESLRRIKKDGFAGICMIGMGGSSIAGSLCQDLLVDKMQKPIVSVRDYSLPRYVSNEWIVIATSYSGNTEETLSALREAKERGCRTVCLTSGGQMKEEFVKDILVPIPQGFQPRAALPLLMTLLVQILEELLHIEKMNFEDVRNNLVQLKQDWYSSEQSPRTFAKSIQGKIPVFIGTSHTKSIAYRAKCQVNENAKYVAFYTILPEGNHNEIESLRGFMLHKILPIFIRSDLDSPKIQSRIEATSQIYGEEIEEVKHLQFDVDTQISEMLAIVFYLDLVSLELAELEEVNPVEVNRIRKLKRILSDS
jgi:glucose/mannose-6-phosphate isomerase